jgi:hypothetical protein
MNLPHERVMNVNTDERVEPGANLGKGHTTTVVINAREYEVETKELSFEEVVNLAYNNNPPRGENVIITVTYSRGEHGNEGSLLPGDSIKVKNKMVFDVSATDRS